MREMDFSKYRAIVVATALFLPACSFSESALWPSLTGEDPAADSPSSALPASESSANQTAVDGDIATQPPQLGTTDFTPVGVTPGQDTGTFVGRKVAELRSELQRLQDQVSTHNSQLQTQRAEMVGNAQKYHGLVASINSRLQVGTTPGNPILVQQFNSAQTSLDNLNVGIASMNKLATSVSGMSTMSSYLAESTRAAFGVSGAVDEDHRQLTILEDEVDQTVVLIERLLTETTEDIRRQSSYVASERSNLNTVAAGIKTGEIYGASLNNVAQSASGPGAVAGKPMDTTGRRPLVVIRFDRDKVPYQQALYNAVGKVLERRPNAAFDLVAVAPTSGGPARVALNSTKARRQAEEVLRSLVEMGLPPARVAVSGKTIASALTNEVHLYLR
jgi:TolA-binding protein